MLTADQSRLLGVRRAAAPRTVKRGRCGAVRPELKVGFAHAYTTHKTPPEVW